ncbi:GGDEF domain-containing protein [Stakelama saccharophila]|uniref:diguanylate cyclase n=1 Tax=Stakelama saccharophila TaxID=3075605 RepID=A0ABZ0BAT2_9SPHN|nr:diguanylate cyclase [Stakelama sp. W311]WNO54387.1 diguanylate cyclase [Stakelama sp. W311]
MRGASAIAFCLLFGAILLVRPTDAGAKPLQLNRSLCHAVTALDHDDTPPAGRRFSCTGEPSGYQQQSLWLRLDPARAGLDPDDLTLMIHQTRFDRAVLVFRYADGTVVRQQVVGGDFGSHWRAGGQVAFEAPQRAAPVRAATIRFDKLASHRLLRIRAATSGAAEVQSASLAMLIGAALTLLLIGVLYNVSLAIAVRRRFLAWHAGWAASVLIWGFLWSQLVLVLAPGLAGTASAQTCTFLACLAVTLATISAVSPFDSHHLPRIARMSTLALGLAVGLIGIPAALVRGPAIGPLGAVLGVLVLADLLAVAVCLACAWRRGSAEARDLAAAWSVPMAALGLTQFVDVESTLWGGGSQLLVLFASAWQTLWLSIAATRRLARLRIERDRARAAEARASELASRDPLTGLNNRRGFFERIAPLLDRAQADATPLALLVLDIDRFKAINDVHGHDTGDAVIVTIAERLSRWDGPMCVTARLGGEEFALMIAGLSGFALAHFADNVRREIAACDHQALVGSQRVTVSIGVATAGPAARDFQQLYQRADGALYAAKQNGRDRVVHARPEDRIATEPLLANR